MEDTSQRCRIRLHPTGRTFELPRGTPLRESLFQHGAEFPCGGRGRCRGCRVRVLEGELPADEADRRLLTAAELAAGWRLGCRAVVHGPVTLEVAQWESTILADDSRMRFQPRPGFGVAVDLGTTTVAAQLLELSTGQVLGVETAWNAQALHGADVMSRIDFAVHDGGRKRLSEAIRGQIGEMIDALMRGAPRADPPVEVVLVGNTAMHHLFGDLDVAPLAHTPFETAQGGELRFAGAELGWRSAAGAEVWFLPCVGGFVGSDILAGVLATGLQEAAEPELLIDLGTNGEIVAGDGRRMVCASTAAGPAFEGARIRMGMRAAAGAIAQVTVVQGRLDCRVLGGGGARGVCGSGLVDAVACGLELGVIQPSGRLAGGDGFELADAVRLEPGDIRELQLAKGAIAAGTRMLLDRLGLTGEAVRRVHLAGAFGNYLSVTNARRIGLLPFPPERVVAAGNTALRGAKLALLRAVEPEVLAAEPGHRIEHVALNEDTRFHEVYVEEMTFPR